MLSNAYNCLATKNIEYKTLSVIIVPDFLATGRKTYNTNSETPKHTDSGKLVPVYDT